MFYSQDQYDIRVEWGAKGVISLAPTSEALVIVDILSFTTCVDICLDRGATIFPFSWKGERAEEFAKAKHAQLASKRSKFERAYSLAPSSLITIPKNFRLVLPSPNGSTLTLEAAKYTDTYAGCFRNMKSLCAYLMSNYKKITVIPSGERWEDGTLRPAIEDWIGAGGIVAGLNGKKSPEAELAETAFHACKNISQAVHQCSSGVELRERGFEEDVALAVERDVSQTIPFYRDEMYIDRNENKAQNGTSSI